jgi:general secretion pathway protein G
MRKCMHIKRRFITLIEIMIVMFLIALITGVLAYNYRGSLEEGKAFKTKQGIERLETILNLAAADDPSILDHIESRWKDVVNQSPLVQNPNTLLKDGWGGDYQVGFGDKGQIEVVSQNLNRYQASNKTLFKGK